MAPTPIRQLGEQLGLWVLPAEDANSPDVLDSVSKLKPDLLVAFAFNQKLGRELLTVARYGAINVHPSLLPKYRGAAPVAKAILNGEPETGISIIEMVRDLDAGGIFAQRKWSIDLQETTVQLEQRLGKLAAPMLTKVVEDIAHGRAVCYPQDHEKATGAPKLKKSDGALDFSVSAAELVNHIRACTPWPGAFTFFCGKLRPKPERVVVTLATSQAQEDQAARNLPLPGTLTKGLCIQCGKGLLEIERLRPAGSKEMNWADFVNGRNVRANDRFLPPGDQP